MHSIIFTITTDMIPQRLYVHFDSKVAYNYSIVREEAEHLWQESADRRDGSIATAAAASVLYILYGSDGGMFSS